MTNYPKELTDIFVVFGDKVPSIIEYNKTIVKAYEIGLKQKRGKTIKITNVTYEKDNKKPSPGNRNNKLD
jgi:hypothetical protein